MTMPTLIQKHQEKATVARLKKFYSVMEQAYLMAQNEYGDPSNRDLIADGNLAGAQNMAEKFKPYLKVVGDGKVSGDAVVYQLADGSKVGFTVRNPNCDGIRGTGRALEVCGAVYSYDRKDIYLFMVITYKFTHKV